MSNGKAEGEDVAPEERGVDKGYECKLIPEQRDDPEFRKLIEEDDLQANCDMHTENYGAKMRGYQRELDRLD